MLSIALQTVAAFNLVCTGTVRTGPVDRATDTRPFTQTFRLDLDQRRWCMGSCEETQEIRNVGNRFITLQAATGEPNWGITYLNHETGKMTDHSVMNGVEKHGEADCERRDFTGFPRLRF